MDDIEELKQALGPAAGNYSETQLRCLSQELDVAAEFLLDLYAYKRSRKSEKPATLYLTDSPYTVG